MKIVVCVDITEEGLKSMKNATALVARYPFSDPEIHFVHVFETKVYAIDLYAAVYPTREQYNEIDEAVVRTMKTQLTDIRKDVLLPDQTKFICLHAFDPKECLVEYLQKEKVEMVVVPTRGLTGVKGLLNSSFAEYMVRHAHCPVLVAKNG